MISIPAHKQLACFIAVFFLVCQDKLNAQLQQDTVRKAHYLVVPIIFKSPENGFAYGLTGSVSFNTAGRKDSTTRLSVIQAVGFLTTRQQNVQVIDASVFFPKEKFILSGQIGHSYFPDKFWGVGPDTKDNIWEHYLYEQAQVSPHLKKKVAKHLFIGALYEFQTVYRINYTDAGIFESSDFYGKTNYKVSGLGLSITYDTRNSAFWPTKGVYLQTQGIDFRKEFLSDYDVLKWVTDLRYFQKIAKGHILAMQVYNYQTFGKTPLRQLASFGGPNNMRGFYQGRFRANNMITFIAEYRLHLYKRFNAVLFGGLGNIYNQYSELKAANIKYSYGGGLRFAMLEKDMLNIRVDYGYSNKFNQGLYVTVAECF